MKTDYSTSTLNKLAATYADLHGSKKDLNLQHKNSFRQINIGACAQPNILHSRPATVSNYCERPLGIYKTNHLLPNAASPKKPTNALLVSSGRYKRNPSMHIKENITKTLLERPGSIATKRQIAFMEKQNLPSSALAFNNNKLLNQASIPKVIGIQHSQRNALNHSLTSEIKNSIGDYIIGRAIGQGAYAQVKEATQKSTGKKVAIKIYEKYRLQDPQRKRSVNNEISILKKIDHNNIAKLYDTIDTNKQLYLIMEYAKGTSLHSFTKTKIHRQLSEKECRNIFWQIVQAINYCHSKGFCHRDIKMDNIIVDKSLNVKVIDFGFSTYISDQLKVYCGTPSYMAPEIVTKTPYYGQMADMWALGILLFTLLEGFYPFKAPSDKELYRKISKGVFTLPDSMPSDAKKLIVKLLIVDPKKRLTTDKVLSDGYFNEKPDLNIFIDASRKSRLFEKYGSEAIEKLLMKYSYSEIDRDISNPASGVYAEYMRVKGH